MLTRPSVQSVYCQQPKATNSPASEVAHQVGLQADALDIVKCGKTRIVNALYSVNELDVKFAHEQVNLLRKLQNSFSLSYKATPITN